MTDAQPTSAADFNAAIIEEFRANAGAVGAMFRLHRGWHEAQHGGVATRPAVFHPRSPA